MRACLPLICDYGARLIGHIWVWGLSHYALIQEDLLRCTSPLSHSGPDKDLGTSSVSGGRSWATEIICSSSTKDIK